jgi:Zn finger protein HypA/HybF involved in hydrogenase expression
MKLIVRNYMPEGYCVKCKAKKEIANGVEETMKNGRKAIKGKCPTCGTVMFKILGGKGTTPASSPNSPSSSTPATPAAPAGNPSNEAV